MKKLITLLTCTLFACTLQAQTQKIVKKNTTTASVAAKPKPAPTPVVGPKDDYSVYGKNFLNAGVGIGTYYEGLPFGASFEHGFTNNISAGVFIDYSTHSYADFPGSKLNIIYGGVRGSYHFAKLFNVTNPKFDPYAGVALGYYSVNFTSADFGSPYSSTVFFGVHAGARYLFSNNIGGFAEVGYGVAALNLGLSFKFQ
jgi:hypothetical protein